MAKSLRSKVKKRLRAVKRGVVKRELTTKGTSHNDGEISKAAKMAEALSGHIKPGKSRKNAFRSDDPEAVIPQHAWRQGPDFRSAFAGDDAGFAVVGSNRPKDPLRMGSANVYSASVQAMHAPMPLFAGAEDAGYTRLMMMSEQLVPKMASKKTKLRVKNKSGVDINAAFRWT